jgi:hypothetical protein
VAEVIRGRIPFENWVEPRMRRQGQLQPQVNRMPREGIHCFNKIARCTILSKGGSAQEGRHTHLSDAATRQGDSSFSNHLARLFIIAHGDERAMPQMPGFSPFDECDLAYQLRFDPPALLHFLRG